MVKFILHWWPRILFNIEAKVKGTRRDTWLSCQGNPQKIDSRRTDDVASGQEQSGECKGATGAAKCQTGRVTNKYRT